jgi:hypothetical protein
MIERAHAEQRCEAAAVDRRGQAARPVRADEHQRRDGDEGDEERVLVQDAAQARSEGGGASTMAASLSTSARRR